MSTKKRVTQKDIDVIQLCIDRGLDNSTICTITGWSKSVISRIRQGIYFEEKEAKRLAAQKKTIKPTANNIKSAPQAESVSIVEPHSSDIADDIAEIKSLLKISVALLSELRDLWK